jgi:hypothetical protein
MVHTVSEYTIVIIDLASQSEAKKPGYEQLYIFDCNRATAERLENQENEGYMAEVIR